MTQPVIINTMRKKSIEPVAPGEMLREELLKPLGMTNYRLAKEIRVPAQRIGEIIAGRRAITADTELRLCRFFGLSEGWWLRLQADHDMRKAKAVLAKELALIKPLKRDVSQLKGLVAKASKPVTLEAMKRAIAKGATGR